MPMPPLGSLVKTCNFICTSCPDGSILEPLGLMFAPALMAPRWGPDRWRESNNMSTRTERELPQPVSMKNTNQPTSNCMPSFGKSEVKSKKNLQEKRLSGRQKRKCMRNRQGLRGPMGGRADATGAQAGWSVSKCWRSKRTAIETPASEPPKNEFSQSSCGPSSATTTP